jgi:predicted transglutaminase-like cysteine proteinase
MSALGQIARILISIAMCCSIAFADTQPKSVNWRGVGASDNQFMLGPKLWRPLLPQTETPTSRLGIADDNSFLFVPPADEASAVRLLAEINSLDLVTQHATPLTSSLFPTAEEALLSPEILGGTIPDLQLIPTNKSPVPAGPRLGMLTPNAPNHNNDVLPSTEPFDLPVAVARSGDVSTKWADVQSRIVADERTLAACRSNTGSCPKAAKRFLSIISLGRQQHGRARLGWINRAVNLTIRPMSDWAQYGYADYWASPLQTLRSEAGDCEDYAIVKYVALHELGIRSRDLRLVIVRDNSQQAEHAVVAVHYEQRWLILDNRTMAMSDAKQVQYYSPLFVMDYRGARRFVSATAQAER